MKKIKIYFKLFRIIENAKKNRKKSYFPFTPRIRIRIRFCFFGSDPEKNNGSETLDRFWAGNV